ncbi:MAG: hypothetical protein GF313_09430 [Caldithrix sp.]|nr:hypothetical protein [Caldithrix sp.]
MKRLLITIFVFLLFTAPLQAQNLDNFSNIDPLSQYSDRPAQYILGSGDILLVNVNLWGHVQRPGIYSIPSAYTLIDLISSAGGPLKTARLNDVRIVRKNQQVITIDIEEFLKTGNNELLPVLQPGDTIIVSGSIQDIFTRIVGIMRDVAIIANVFVLATRVN